MIIDSSEIAEKLTEAVARLFAVKIELACRLIEVEEEISKIQKQLVEVMQ